MKRFGMKLVIACFCVILLGLTWISCASGGDSTDPIISLSFLSNRIQPNLSAKMTERVNAAGDLGLSNLYTKRNEALGKLSQAGIVDAAVSRVREYLQSSGRYMYYTDTMRQLVLKKDDVISGAVGTQLSLRYGSAIVVNSSLIDVTNGTLRAAGTAAPQNTRFILNAKNWSGLRVTSESATVFVQGYYRIAHTAYKDQYVDMAHALKVMGLFKGTATGYQLSKHATRAEAVTMLVRLVGEEKAAQSQTARHSFTDVPAWANGYVGHAFLKGYTKGTSATLFSPNVAITAPQYMTFLLRALGYNDAAGDFSWKDALSAAVRLGIINPTEKKTIEGGLFRRDQMVFLSYRTLFTKRKGTNQTLLQYLQANGAVSQANAASGTAMVSR
ncbi:MAG: S-layer homology domain-containing protein [Oscillospiraceae bacterium]|nr:S-layer homology domain-containing protein [Oscillospiraceae bacterium]